MSYKRYIKVGGKSYGPYVYGSKREGDKIVSEYVGKSSAESESRSVKGNGFYGSNSSKIIVIVFLALAIVALGGYFYTTGNAALGIQEQYNYGEKLSGTLNFVIDSGDSIDTRSDLKIVLKRDNNVVASKDLTVSDFLQGLVEPVSVSNVTTICVNVSVDSVVPNCTMVDDGNGTLVESCVNMTVTNMAENCTDKATGGDYYQTAGTYSKNIADFIDYNLSSEGDYVLSFSSSSLGLSEEKSFSVSAPAAPAPVENVTPPVLIENITNVTIPVVNETVPKNITNSSLGIQQDYGIQATCTASISSCCQILSPGTYNVTANISFKTATLDCIEVASNDVVLEGNGFYVIGNYTGSYGIYAGSTSTNNLTIRNFGVINNSYGFVVAGHNVTIINSRTDLTDYGIQVVGTGPVEFDNATLSRSVQYAIYLATPSNVKLVNVTGAIYPNDLWGGFNNTEFIDTHLRLYSIVVPSYFASFKDTGEGEIKFLMPINDSGTNLSRDIQIGYNFVSVNGSKGGLNMSANVTLYNLPTNMLNPRILRNGVQCSDCYNFTSLNAGTVVFNVTGWSNYSIVDANALSACGNITSSGSYILAKNLTTTGNCFNITVNNVVLDGAGYGITGDGGPGDNGIYLQNTINVAITNLTINRFETGIFSNGANSSVINGVTLYSNTLTGIYLLNSNFNNFSSITGNSSGVGLDLESSSNNTLSGINLIRNLAHGLLMVAGSSNTVMNSNFSTSGSSYAGVYISGSSRNNLSNIIINNCSSGYALLLRGPSNTFTNLYLGSNGYGIDLDSSSAYSNSLTNVLATNSNQYGLNLKDSYSNNYTNMTLNLNYRGIYVWNSDSNNFVNLTVINSTTTDLLAQAGGISSDYNLFSNYYIGNYDLTTGTNHILYFENSGVGRISFLTGINGSGTNLTSDIFIANNSAYVNSSQAGLNRSANVTLYNIPAFSNPTILRDGVACPANICKNFTALTGAVVQFNVTGWSNYSIGEGPLNNAPNITSIILNSTTAATNNLNNNLTLWLQGTDANGDSFKNITNWYVNGQSIMVLNMPFEGGSNATWTKDYALGNNGTVSGATWNSTGGYDGRGAYMFNGVNGQIDASPSAGNFTSENFSISLWVNELSNSNNPILISKGTANIDGYNFQISGSNLQFITNQLSAYQYTSTNDNCISLGVWEYITVVRNGATVKIYCNGVESTYSNNDSHNNPSSSTNNLRIAGYVTAGFNLNGSIDDVQIYNRGLSAMEIKALYQNKTNIIVSQELSIGQNWSACVTPNDRYVDGNTVCSNNITIKGNSAPVIGLILLNSTNPSINDTTENLTLYTNATDADGDNVSYSGEWYKNGQVFIGPYWNATLSGITAVSYAYDVALGSNNNSYIAGGYNNQAFVASYDADGNLLWRNSYGGTVGSGSRNYGVFVDNNSNVYAAGLVSTGGQDVLVAKLYGNGTRAWNKTIGDGSSDSAYGVTTDSAGNVYVVGWKTSSASIYVVKYDLNGNFQWDKVFAGSNSLGSDIVSDSNNNIYVLGRTSVYGAGSWDVWVLKLNSSGGQVWNKTYGTNGSEFSDYGRIKLDSAGNLYISATANNNKPWTIKTDNNGTVLWSNIFESGFSTYGTGIGLDSTGNVYSNSEHLLIKYDSLGNYIVNYSTSNFNLQYGYGLALGSDGGLYTAGSSNANAPYLLKLKDGFSKANQIQGQSILADILQPHFLGAGDNWTACARAFDGSLFGNTLCSGNMTLVSGLPVMNFTLLNSTNPLTNDTDQNLTVYAEATSILGNNLTYSGNWYKNNQPFVFQYWNASYNSVLGSGSDVYSYDFAYGVATDNNNNIYVTGATNGNSPSSSHSYYTIKYDSNGNQIWNRSYSNNNDNSAYGIATDNNNNIYVTGVTNEGAYNTYTIKYDSNGNQIWNRSYDSGGSDQANGVATDSSGNVYVTGVTNPNFLNYDYLTIKYDSNGNQIWNRTYDSGGTDYAYGVATDSGGNIYVTGQANNDYYTIKYNSSGSQIWGRTYDSGSGDRADGVATDSSGNVYVTGGANGDYYTIKYDSNGNQIWSRTYDSGGSDEAHSIAIYGSGNIYVVGGIDTGNVGRYSTIKYDSNGNLVWNTTYVAAGNTYGTGASARGVATDSSGDVYVTGYGLYDNSIYKANYYTIKYRGGFSKANQIQSQTVLADTLDSSFTLENDIWMACTEAFDAVGSTGMMCSNITISDIIPPNGTLISPANGSHLNNPNVNFVANVSDTGGLKNATLYVYNQTGLYYWATVNLYGAFNSLVDIPIALVDGVYTWFYTIFDLAGNLFVTENYTLSLDATAPTIEFVSPTDTGGILPDGRNNILINVTANDSNFENLTVDVYGSNILINETLTMGTNLFLNITDLVSGAYSLNATAFDSYGNSNSTETRTVIIGLNSTNVTTCGHITVPGNYYLQNDILGISGDCIVIVTDNVTFDGNGFILTGAYAGSGSGVSVYPVNNVSVMNMSISGFSAGVFVNSSSDFSLANLTLSSNSGGSFNGGIYVYNCSSGFIENVTASSNGNFGIELDSSNNVSVRNVTAESNSNYGVWINYGGNNSLSEVSANSNLNYGIYLSYTDENEIYNAGMTSNNAGIWSDYSNYNIFSNISTYSNPHGVYNNYGNYNSYSNMNLSLSFTDGIYSQYGTGNDWENSSIVSDRFSFSPYGVYVVGESGDLFRNISTDSNGYGFWFSSVSYSNMSELSSSNNWNQALSLDSSDYNYLSWINVSSSNRGIYGQYADWNVLENVESSSNGGDGVAIYYGTYNNLSNVNSYSNGNHGMTLYNEQYDIVTNVTSYSNSQYGIMVDGSTYYTVFDNITSNNNSHGFYINSYSYYNNLTNLFMDNNGYGLYCYNYNQYNYFENITINNSYSGQGLTFSYCDWNTLKNVVVENTSGGSGVYIDSSNYNNFTNVVSRNNPTGYGIYFPFYTTGNIVDGSLLENNYNGLEVDAGDSYNFNNFTINGSTGYGVYVINILIYFNLTNAYIENSSINGISLSSHYGNYINITVVNSGSDGLVINSGAYENTFENLNILGSLGNSITDYSGNYNSLSYSNEYGRINWTDSLFLSAMSVVGELSYPGNIKIENDSAYVNSSAFAGEMINSSADVTLSGLRTDYLSPAIFRDGLACNAMTVPACANYTDLNGGDVRFSVGSWSNYSIDSGLTGYLVSPENNTYTNNTSQNFTANASGAYGLGNATLNIFNSTGLYNQTTIDLGGTFNSMVGIVVDLVDGVYQWFYALFDLNNSLFVTENRTITIDTVPPVLTILFPEGAAYNYHNQSLDFSVYDAVSQIDSCWKSLNGAVNETISCYENSTVNSSSEGTLEGDNVIYLYANDSSGNIASASVYFTISTVAPSINLVSPIDFGYVNSSTVNFTFYVVDQNGISACGLYGNWSSGWHNNYTLSPVANDSENSIVVDGISEGSYMWNVLCNNTLNSYNWHPDNHTFTVDTTNPGINFSYPSEISGSYLNRDSILINVSASDVNFANITISLYDSTNLVNGTTTQTEINYVNISSLADGVYFFNASARDLANNVNYTETRNVTIDRTNPLIIYGYNVFADGSNVSQSFVYVNVSVVELNEANITFGLWNATGVINVTTLAAGSREINWTGLSDGSYYYNVSVVDVLSNSNATSTRKITLDRTAPNATLIGPVNNTYTNVPSQNFSANLTDNLSGLKNATLNIYNQTGLYNQTTIDLGGTLNNLVGIVVNLVDGTYIWFYGLFDFAGNLFVSENSTILADSLNPTVIIVVPQNGANYTTTSIEINYSASDLNLQACWWSVSGGAANSSVVCGQNISYTAGQGLTTVDIWANDSTGNVGSDSRTFFVDSIIPLINFVPPTEGNGTMINRNNIMINVSVSDTNFVNVTIELFNATASVNRTVSTNAVTYLNIQGLSDGFYKFNATVVDILGNSNSTDTWVVAVDTTDPIIRFEIPTENNGDILDRSNIVMNVSAYNMLLANITTRLYNSTGIVNQTVRTSSPAFVNVTNLPDGLYSFNATAEDRVGLMNSTETRNIRIDTHYPLIAITSPLNTSYNYSVLDFNYTVSDDTLQSCWWTNDSGATNISIPVCGQNISYAAGQGSTTLRIYANDSKGKTNSSSVTFIVDMVAPVVSLVSPGQNYNSTSSSITFRCNATDNLALANVTFYMWNSSGAIYRNSSANIAGQFYSYEVNVSNVMPGTYNWNCLFSDGATNGAFAVSNGTMARASLRQFILIVVDGLQVAHFDRLLAAGNLTNFSYLIGGNGWNGTANITGHVTTETAPGNAEIMTGLNETLNGVHNNTQASFAVPTGNTTFERLKAYDANIKTGYVYGKTTAYIPNGVLANALSGIDWKNNRTTYTNTDWPDNAPICTYGQNVSNKAAEFIQNYSNESFYLVVYYGTPDCSGHVAGENSTNYDNAVINADAGLGILLSTLGAAGLRGANNLTEIVVTADHGWNTNTTGHGTANSDTIVIPLLTNDKNLTANNSGGIRKQCDIAPTTLDYFGVPGASYGEILNNGCDSMREATIVPSITVNSPSGSYSSSTVLFNVSLGDYAARCNFTIDSGATNNTMATSDNLEFTATLSDLVDGDYTASFYCWDYSNNLGSATSSFSVSSSSGSGSGGGGGGGGSKPATVNWTFNVDGGGKFGARVGNGNIVYLIFEGQTYTLLVDGASNSGLAFELSSFGLQTLSTRGSREYDLNGDGLNDILITYNGYVNGKADITIEALRVEKAGQQGAGENATVSEVVQKVVEQVKPYSQAIIIGIILVVILVVLVISVVSYSAAKAVKMGSLKGKSKKNFVRLAEIARKALRANNYGKARQVYGRMKFEYHTLGSQDQKDMKAVMDSIYEKIENGK